MGQAIKTPLRRSESLVEGYMRCPECGQQYNRDRLLDREGVIHAYRCSNCNCIWDRSTGDVLVEGDMTAHKLDAIIGHNLFG